MPKPITPADPVSRPWSTGKIQAALAEKYAPPEHALLFEVPDATGANATRSADALAMSVWPSRGLTLIGFEIKSARSDWLREMRDPAKAERIARHCDQWYIVAGHPDLVAAGELPAGWGLLAPRGDKLIVKVEAPKLDPMPVNRNLLAGIFRRAAEKFERSNRDAEAEEIKARAHAESYRQGREAGELAARGELNKYKAAVDARDQAIRDFEAASGMKIQLFQGAKIGRAVRLVLDDAIGEVGRQMRQAESAAANMTAIAGAYRDEVRKIEEERGHPALATPID